MSFNNPKCSLSDFLMQKKQQISYEINNLNNDIIMANTVQDIVNNIQIKYMLEVIQISDSEIDRDIRENTVRKYNPFYHRGSCFDKEYYDVPGFTVKFSHSIIGNIDLLSYHASTYLMWHPDNLNISKNVLLKSVIALFSSKTTYPSDILSTIFCKAIGVIFKKLNFIMANV